MDKYLQEICPVTNVKTASCSYEFCLTEKIMVIKKQIESIADLNKDRCEEPFMGKTKLYPIVPCHSDPLTHQRCDIMVVEVGDEEIITRQYRASVNLYSFHPGCDPETIPCEDLYMDGEIWDMIESEKHLWTEVAKDTYRFNDINEVSEIAEIIQHAHSKAVVYNFGKE